MKISKSMAVAALVLSPLFALDNASASVQTGKGLDIWFDAGGPVGDAYNTVVQNGAEQACIDLGCNIRFLYSDWSPQKMLENFSHSLASEPDGIVIMGSPGDDAYEPLISRAREQGVLVTTAGTELPRLEAQYQSEGFGYAGMPNRTRGAILAHESLERFNLKEGDKAMVWGVKSTPNRGLSTIGMIDTLEEAGLDVDYLEISTEVGNDPILGLPHITSYLSRNPDVKLIMVDHGAMTSQMENFLRSAGKKPGEIHVAGFSMSPATASAVRNNYVQLIGDGQPYLQGYLPVLQLVLSKRFGFAGLNINTGSGFITPDNIDFIAPLAEKGIR